jgi:hypothetical protein
MIYLHCGGWKGKQMDITQKQLIHLISAIVRHGDTNMEPDRELFAETDTEKLCNLAGQQGVLASLYPVVHEYASLLQLDEKVMERWKKTAMFTAIRQLQYSAQIKTIFELFEANQIPVISLKGLVLKNLYPQPELRNMCDLDVLINLEDFPEAMKLLRSLGYELPQNFDVSDPGHKHIEMHHPESLTVELHKTLLDPRYMKKQDIHFWLGHIWEYKRLVEMDGVEFTALSLDDELINLIIHLATHLVYSGGNVRQLCDIALFLQHYEEKFDFGYVNDMLQRLNLLSVFQYVLLSCRLYFKLAITATEKSAHLNQNICELLMDDLFNCGHEDTESWKVLTGRYPFYRNHRKYFPLVFILETGRQVIKKQRGLSDSVSYAKRSLANFEGRRRLLEHMGIRPKINRDFS